MFLLEFAAFALGSLIFWIPAVWIGFLLKRRGGALVGGAVVSVATSFGAIRNEFLELDLERFEGAGARTLMAGLLAGLPYFLAFGLEVYDRLEKLIVRLGGQGAAINATIFFALLLFLEFLASVISWGFAFAFLGFSHSWNVEAQITGRLILAVIAFVVSVTVAQIRSNSSISGDT